MNFSFRNSAFTTSATISSTFIYVAFLIWSVGFDTLSQETRNGGCRAPSSVSEERLCVKMIAELLVEHGNWERGF